MLEECSTALQENCLNLQLRWENYWSRGIKGECCYLMLIASSVILSCTKIILLHTLESLGVIMNLWYYMLLLACYCLFLRMKWHYAFQATKDHGSTDILADLSRTLLTPLEQIESSLINLPDVQLASDVGNITLSNKLTMCTLGFTNVG